MGFEVFPVPESGLISLRINELKEYFFSKFNEYPLFYTKAPGRVNVIGEHIDYSGYAVFPMGISQNVLVALAKRSDEKIVISNLDPCYEEFEGDINKYEIKDLEHKWYKYVLCGLQGIKDEGNLSGPLPGLSLAISGNIPPGAGLSSSSALVCGSALAFAHFCQFETTLTALAELCAHSERYIGTQGGGMDQAASLLSNAGSAQIIEFNPLRCTPVTLPVGTTFVVANSLVEMNKATRSEFNTRVVECRLGCRLMAKRLNVPIKKNMQFGQLQNMLNFSFSEMVEHVKKYLHPQPYSKQELAQLFNLSVSQLEKELLSENTLHVTEFNLYKRALHVFTEASRVWEFKAICDDWSSRSRFSSDEDKMKVVQQLSKLIDESHQSAQHLYECSHPKLDKLVEISRKVALGARLTGAGWGGCVIAMVDKDQVEEYHGLMRKEYYASESLDVKDWSSVLFTTTPSRGAQIYCSSKGSDNGHQ